MRCNYQETGSDRPQYPPLALSVDQLPYPLQIESELSDRVASYPSGTLSVSRCDLGPSDGICASKETDRASTDGRTRSFLRRESILIVALLRLMGSVLPWKSSMDQHFDDYVVAFYTLLNSVHPC